MFIRSERLMLRPIFPEDWREIFHGIADESIVRMLARAPWPYTADHARTYCSRRRDPGEMQFVITLPGDTGAPVIGAIGLEAEQAGKPLQLGYWIARAWQGQGYITEAVAAVLQTARALGVQRAEAGHFEDNPASGRVLMKCGFVPTGDSVPAACAGRGGELVGVRRYVAKLAA